MNDLWIAVVAFVGVLIGALSTFIMNRNNRMLKYVTNERRKWRSDVRKYMRQLSVAENKLQFFKIESKFALILNPDDGEDQEILMNLQMLQALSATSKEQIDNRNLIQDLKREVMGRVSLLLKHDWERSKFESGVQAFLPNFTRVYLFFAIFTLVICGLLWGFFVLGWETPTKIYDFFNWDIIIWGELITGLGILIAYFMRWIFSRTYGFMHLLGYPMRIKYNDPNSTRGTQCSNLVNPVNQAYNELKKFTETLSRDKDYNKSDVFKHVKEYYETIISCYRLKGDKISLDELLLYLKDQVNDTETTSFYSGFAVIVSSIALVFSIVSPFLVENISLTLSIELTIYLIYILMVASFGIYFISKVDKNYRFVHQNRIYKLLIMLIEREL